MFADLNTLGLWLITELSACVQRVSSDLAQAQAADDLEPAQQRWAQQLRALAETAEGASTRQCASLLPSETPLHELPPYPRRNASTQPITGATRIPVASVASPDAAAEQTPQEMPINPPLAASFRWIPLTAREREVLKLTQRGYPPRRIAPRLVVEVETVYTHLRNIRRKQRAWEQAHQARQQP
jgi:DNA-binding CsgD family transcriptional regulator